MPKRDDEWHLLEGDDDFDPERIRKDLERLRKPPQIASDARLKRAIVFERLLKQQDELRLRRELPGLTDEQEAALDERLQALDIQLQRLRVAEKLEDLEPPPG
jgi:hypothetical protein